MFAAIGFETYFWLGVILLIAAAWGLFQFYMIRNHPEEWRIMQQQQHERRMDYQRQQREREADRRATKNKVLGAGGALLKAFLGRK